MLAYRATYKLSNDNGTTTFISKPFSTKEEAKKSLYEELDMLEYDGELNNMSYCNVLEESVIRNTHERDNMFIDVLNHLFTPPYNEETGEIEEEVPTESTAQKPKKINLEKINNKMKKLELKKRNLELKLKKVNAKIEAKLQSLDMFQNPLGVKLEYPKGIKISHNKDYLDFISSKAR